METSRALADRRVKRMVPREEVSMPIREALKLIYRNLMILITAALGLGTIAAWWYATPGNGLLLVSGILAILTLIAGLSINKLEWQDRHAETFAGIVRDMRFLKDDAVSIQYAEPEVHRVDAAGLDDAKRMAAAGAPIDDICRAIDPEHDRHDPAHQEAFRKIVRAMIEQG
jgi:hypothetical protein